MAMDAITAKSLDSLLQDVLPRLKAKLEQLKKVAPEKRSPDEDVAFLLNESFELLKLLQKWALHKAVPKSGRESPSDSNAAIELNEEMSDEEALAALAAMDESTTHKHSKPVAQQELSDEEALLALAAMDAPVGANHDIGSDAMSDDEAMAALAAMDEPASAATSANNEELSDEEALRMLSQMEEGVGTTAKNSEAEMAMSATSDFSADEAALSLLASMEDDGGLTVSAAPILTAKPASPPPKAESFPAQHPEPSEQIDEIEEFGNSEFSSDPEMIKDFMENASELMQSLDEQILILESDPSSKATIEEIFRAAHTLKGAAGMFGYRAIERIMHKMENFFDRVRKGTVVANSDAIDVVLRGLDALKSLMQGVSSGAPTGIKTAPIVRELALLGEGKYTKSAAATTPPEQVQPVTKPDSGKIAKDVVPTPQVEGKSGGGSKGKKQEDSTIRVDLRRLDALVNLVGELVTDRTRFMNIEEDLRTISPQLKSTHNMTQTVQLFGRHMNEIQETIMKVRMVPIGNAFNKFSRIVRDLARQLDKEIDLIIEGEATELDKTLVEQIGDPLVHLIRNSCDHGIELPEKRRASGKKPTGTIALSARQEGNQIIITIEDDGKGIDADIIRRKAIEKGLISEDAMLSERDIFGLIFEPGFSTAEQVTNISGRGVGMDVVKRQIMKLKGMIDIGSKVGVGTTITIQLPLTLAIVQSLLVKSRAEIFAIPLTSVVESIRIAPSEIQKVGDAEVIKRRDQVLPLFYLDEILELQRRDELFWYRKDEKAAGNPGERSKDSRRREERLFVVVVGSADRRFGIVVDTLLNQQEMVIKTMGSLVANIPCVAGGAILGNGEVVLVLDTGEMDELFRSKGRMGIAA